MFGRCGLIKRSRKPLWALGFSLFLFVAPAAEAAQRAVVVTDGALVYRLPDFDAPVLGYLPAGQQVWISTKKFRVAFYRVRLKQGVNGYIADVDVQTEQAAGGSAVPKGPFAGGPAEAPPEGQKASEPSEAQRAAEEARQALEALKTPMTAKSYLGVALGLTSVAEVINKKEYRDSLTMYGVKFSFPLRLGDSPTLLDLQSVWSFTTPKYYKEFGQPQGGYMTLVSASLAYPLLDFATRRGLIYFSGGPMVGYSNYLVEVSGSKLALEEVRAGAVFAFGAALDIGKRRGMFRLEPRYYVEKAAYFSLDMAFQFAL